MINFCWEKKTTCKTTSVEIITKKIVSRTWKDRGCGKGVGWVPTTSSKPFCAFGNKVVINQKPSSTTRNLGRGN